MGHAQSQPRTITQAVPGDRRNVSTAPQLLETRAVLVTQACPFQSSGSRTRRGPPNELYEQDSCWLAKPRSLERGYRGRETNALKGDPRVWTPSHQRSGGEDPLSPRSEAPRMAGRGEMLVDPSEQPHQTPIAAPGRFPKHCRSNLQQEQACPGLRSTGDIAASAAGLWSSLPRLPAESQPL